jgi:hypothetical protein
MSAQKRFFDKEIIKELRFIEAKMKKEEDPGRKNYLFSATYGIMSRSYRYEFSRDVLLCEFVLNQSYLLIADWFNRLKSNDQTVKFDSIIFEKIEEGLKLLADCFENETSILEPLELILTTAFSVTGPGNYLIEKGMITL